MNQTTEKLSIRFLENVGFRSVAKCPACKKELYDERDVAFIILDSACEGCVLKNKLEYEND